MADDKTKRPKLTPKEIKESHGLEIDANDAKGRRRLQRMMDGLYAKGIKIEEAQSDVANGSAVKAAIAYVEHSGGKPITPIEQTTTIVHRTVEESVASILEMLGTKRKEIGIQ